MENGDRSAAVELLRLTAGAWVAQAVSVAARLGIADHLADGARTVDELATATATDARYLRRLLRTLAGVGLFADDGPERFRLGPLGTPLRSDVPGSVRAMCAIRGEPWFWNAWGELLHSVRTGETGICHIYGTDLFGYLDQHPDAAALFNAAMTDMSGTETDAILAAHDFARFKTVVDVGGGRGALLTAILRANPEVRGVLVDLPATVAGAGAALQAAGVADRCTVVGGSFFEAVPDGGDLYLLKSVIHDWDDDRAVAILRTCRKAMGETGRLMLVERVIPPGNAPALARLMDLNMLVLAGGQERTEAEYQALLQCADLALVDVIPTGADMSLVIGVPMP